MTRFWTTRLVILMMRPIILTMKNKPEFCRQKAPVSRTGAFLMTPADKLDFDVFVIIF